MAYDSARPDAEAFRELRILVRHLGDELAAFRRRALQAEARLKAVEPSTGSSPERVDALERENAELRARLEAATARTTQLMERVRFLRQQHEAAQQ